RIAPNRPLRRHKPGSPPPAAPFPAPRAPARRAGSRPAPDRGAPAAAQSGPAAAAPTPRGRNARAAGRAPSGPGGNATADGAAPDRVGRLVLTGPCLALAVQHHFLDLGDGARRVEVLRTHVGAVHDRVAAIQPEGILQVIEALTARLVAAVDDPAVGRKQRRRSEEALTVPPVARTGGRAAGAQNAGRGAVDPLLL